MSDAIFYRVVLVKVLRQERCQGTRATRLQGSMALMALMAPRHHGSHGSQALWLSWLPGTMALMAPMAPRHYGSHGSKAPWLPWLPRQQMWPCCHDPLRFSPMSLRFVPPPQKAQENTPFSPGGYISRGECWRCGLTKRNAIQE